MLNSLENVTFCLNPPIFQVIRNTDRYFLLPMCVLLELLFKRIIALKVFLLDDPWILPVLPAVVVNKVIKKKRYTINQHEDQRVAYGSKVCHFEAKKRGSRAIEQALGITSTTIRNILKSLVSIILVLEYLQPTTTVIDNNNNLQR